MLFSFGADRYVTRVRWQPTHCRIVTIYVVTVCRVDGTVAKRRLLEGSTEEMGQHRSSGVGLTTPKGTVRLLDGNAWSSAWIIGYKDE